MPGPPNTISNMNPRRKEWLEPWHVNPSGSKTYDFIDGLRGIAILLVVGCHLIYYNPNAGRSTRFIGEIFAAGAHGVTVFFVLSGFLISWPFWKSKVKGNSWVVPPGYGWRRFWKVYPPLALSVIVFAPACFLFTHNSELWKIALQWLAGVPLVRPVSGDLNPVMWSMIVEIHFYLVLPLMFLSVKKLSPNAALVALSAVFLVVPTAFRLLNARHDIYFTLHPVINTHFPSMLDAFALGILVAGFDNLGMINRSLARAGDAGLVLIGVALVLSGWLSANGIGEGPVRHEITGWLVKAGAALTLCYAGNPDHPRARLLSTQWLRWCGIISYEWYLFHQPLAFWTRSLAGQAGGNLLKYSALLCGPLVAGLLIAAVVYRCFSLPLLRRGRAKHRVEGVAAPVAVTASLQRGAELARPGPGAAKGG
jgi:peptidoglycan/LPS O-acetylase OafA/YrhL